MKLLKLLFLVLISHLSFGQITVTKYKSKIDSLISLKPNMDHLNAINELTYNWNYIDYELSNKAADYVLKYSNKPTYESINAFAFKVKGIISDEKGRYQDAIEYYLKAIDKYKEIDSQLDIAKCEGNIGIIFRHQQKFQNALEYFRNALEIFQKNDFKVGVLTINSNLGIIYMHLNKLDSSLYFLRKAEVSMKELGIFKANIYGNLGNTYAQMNKWDLAEENYLKCIHYLEDKQPNNRSAVVWYFSYVLVLQKKKEFKKALEYLAKSKALMGSNIYTREALSLYNHIGSISYQIGDYKKSAETYRDLGLIRDSLYRADNSKIISDLAEKYQTKKKELKIESLNKEKKIEEEKVFYLIIGAILLTIIVIYSFISVYIKIKDNKKIRAKNQLIRQQKEMVIAKNNEIMDSIQYAKRLQDAILPNIKLVKKHFVNSFVLFKPKDIVSGDFYWMETRDHLTMFASADCTGHGVPGAMVSVVCANALNKSVNELLITDPGKILDATRDIVVNTFTKTNTDVKDGMDISICVYNTETQELFWAGANNPLWIIRGQTQEIEILIPDKQPIGIYENQSHFTSHNIQINSGDSIYLFSDGYVDQFGGEKGKKLKSNKFKEVLLSIQEKNMKEQKTELDKFFKKWKGDLEQVDDVCVIGVRF